MDDHRIIRQTFSGGIKRGQALAGGGVVKANRQMVNLTEILGGQGVDVLNNLAGLPDGGGVVVAHRRAVGLAADKAIAGAEMDEDGVIGGEGGGGLPVKKEF